MAKKIRKWFKVLFFLTIGLLIVFALVVLRLSTAGVPDSLLRSIEEIAAENGLYLSIQKLKLTPANGLAAVAESLELRAEADNELPLATLDKVRVSFNPLENKKPPIRLQAENGQLHIPIIRSPGKYINCHLQTLDTRATTKGQLEDTDIRLNIEGVDFHLCGSVDLPAARAAKAARAAAASASQTGATTAPAPQQAEEAEATAPAELNLTLLIEEAQPVLEDISRIVDEQQWKEGEFPSQTVEVQYGATLQTSLHVKIPRYDVSHLHLRNGEAVLNYQNDVIDIKQLTFHTIDPVSNVSLTGDYNISTGLFNFDLHSDADLVSTVECFVDNEQLTDLLKKIHPDETSRNDGQAGGALPSSIALSGRLTCTTDRKLKNVRLDGSFTQGGLSIATYKIDTVNLKFHYDKGVFNIEQFVLNLPDGTVKLSAKLENKKETQSSVQDKNADTKEGEVTLKAKIDVDKFLALVSEFTSQPIQLPEGLDLNGPTDLSLTLGLCAKSLTSWQDMVPRITSLSFSANVDELIYDNYQLSHPLLIINVSGILQGENYLPTKLGELKYLLVFNKLNETTKNQENPFSLVNLSFDGTIQGIDLSNLWDTYPSVKTKSGNARLIIEETSHGSLGTDAIDASLVVEKGTLRDNPLFFLRNNKANISISGIRDGDCHLGDAHLEVTMQDGQPNMADLDFSIEHEDKKNISIKTQLNWYAADHILLQNINASISLSAISPILEHFNIRTNEIEWPDNITISGETDINTQKKCIAGAILNISIPKLVRTPHNVKALVGKNVAISLNSNVSFSTLDNGCHNFSANVKANTLDAEGYFKGVISGGILSDGSTKITIEGTNTIPADKVDSLIDLNDAHYVIRDFRFTEKTRNEIKGISVEVTLPETGGVRVDSFCKAELFNVAYMLSGIEVLPDGTERVRTDLGADPFTHCTHASCDVKVHVVDGCANTPNECTITLSNALLEYDNTPWLKRQGFSGGVKNTRMTGDSIIIDVENSFVEINNISGNVYPAYSIGMFYPPLQYFMSDVLFYSPAHVETNQCVFPIYGDCKRPMSGTILVTCAPKSGFRFIGTTIPLTNFSGYIYLTDNYVQLDQLNANCWSGVLNAVVNIGFSGKHTSFDGKATAEAMNLQEIAASYGSTQNYALCNGTIRFRSPSANLEDIQAYGEIKIRNGDLLSLNVFRPIGNLVSNIPGYFTWLEKQTTQALGAKEGTHMLDTYVFKPTGKGVDYVSDGLDAGSNYVPFFNYLFNYSLDDAYCRFTIGNGHLVTHSMKATGMNLKVNADMDLNLGDMTLQGSLWPHISSLPSVIISPLTFLSKFIISINLSGPVVNPEWVFGMRHRSKDTAPTATTGSDKGED